MASRHLNMVLQHLRHAIGADAVETTDGHLVRRFVAQQDETAFRQLLERFGPMVLGVCRRVLSDPHDADDAFQATFLLLVRKAASLKEQELVGNWLYGVAWRIARRARYSAARRALPTAEVPDMAIAEPQPQGDWQELRPLLDEELQRLPRKYRVPLVLCYLEGKTNEATARQLRCPTGTVKTRLAKGRELLRRRLTRRGVVLSAGGLAAALSTGALNAAVPSTLAEATLRTALLCAAGQTLAAAVSAPVAGLVEGAARELFLAKLRLIAAVLAVVGLLGTGAGFAVRQALSGERPAVVAEVPPPAPEPAPTIDDGGLADTLAQRGDAWQPTRAERRFDEVGWARSLAEAQRLARAHGRPIALLTFGGSIATARCPASAFQMRVSALSNDRVIDLLNRHFVPVYLDNQDYADDGPAPAAEKAALRRIRQEGAALQPDLQTTNRLWLLDEDGRPHDTLDGCHAAAVDQLVPLLEKQVRQGQLPSGGAVIAPAPQSRPPQVKPGDLVLHLTARYLERRGAELVPPEVPLGRTRNYGMRGCPAENWIVLDRDQWRKLLPSGRVVLGSSWELAPAATAPLAVCAYPPTEDNDLSRNRVDECALTATVVAVQGSVVRARLEGRIRMKHRFDPERDDDRFVDAALLGFLDFETDRSAIRALRLVTTEATYGKNPFGLAIRLAPVERVR